MGRPKLIGPLTASETKKKKKRKEWYKRNTPLTKRRALESKRTTQKFFREIKEKEVCVECGHDVYEDLDYHHKDPSTKVASVSDMVGSYSRQRILDEIQKCEVLCKNCHMKHHHNYPFH